MRIKLAHEVEVNFVSAGLDDWTGWLARETGVSFDVKPSAREIGPRSNLTNVRLPKMPAARALDVIGVVCGLHWSAIAEKVVLEALVPEPSRCSFFGAVGTSGSLPLQNEDTLLSGLFRAGLLDGGDLSHVVLMRRNQGRGLLIEVDVGKMLRTGQTVENLLLKDGDVVFVPRPSGPPPVAELPPLQLAVGSRLRFVLYDNAATLEGAEQVGLLADPQVVGRHGKIFVPYVGLVEMVGKTKEEVAKAVGDLYRTMFSREMRLDAVFL